jgi:hypothetical protein
MGPLRAPIAPTTGADIAFHSTEENATSSQIIWAGANSGDLPLINAIVSTPDTAHVQNLVSDRPSPNE